MLTDRDYMKPQPHCKIKIIVLPPPSRFATYTPKDWANLVIISIAMALCAVIVYQLTK
ncbi:MAG: hypothetical protein ABIR36_09890 [Nitrospiraceae bacterium]